MAKRVLTLWDANEDGILSAEELNPLVSSTDGMISIGALDSVATKTPLAKQVRMSSLREVMALVTPSLQPRGVLQAWELLVLSLIGWFLYTTVVQLSVAKQVELDEEYMAKRADGKKTS